MKKVRIVLFSVLIFLALFLCACKVKKYDLKVELYVTYVVDGDVYQTATVSRGANFSAPSIYDNSGFVFDGWYSSSDYTKPWEFDTSIYKDLTLYGRWLSETDDFAKVTFMDEGEILSTQRILKGKQATAFLPENKKGYRYGGWSLGGRSFDFSNAVYEDIDLQLIWEFEEFYVEFYCDGVMIDRRPFTVNDTFVVEPPVPYKSNYDGAWSEYELTAGNIRVDAEYKPSVYHICFYALNEMVAESNYTCEDENCPKQPNVPKLTGHKGEWKSFELIGKTVNVFAAYEKLTYELIYVVDGVAVENKTYTYSEVPVDSPTVPPRSGYLCSWEEFEFTEDTTIFINAVYTPITYYATFVADGNEIAKIPFDANYQLLNIPDVPQKVGYIGVWEEFELSLDNTIINAVYTPINYSVTFVDCGEIISIQYFNAENMSVILPAIENKPDFNCFWEDFKLEFKDIVVNVIYEPIEKESLFKFELDGDGTGYTVVGYIGLDKQIIIPQLYKNLPVKRIGSNAFAFCELESVEISYGIECIEKFAFYGCTASKIILPSSVTFIESHAFAESGLTHITVYGNMGEYAFANCRKLESVTISASVKIIAPYALSGCTALKSLEFISPENWAVSKDTETIVGNIPTNKLADSSVATTLYEPMSNYYWIKKSAVK